MAHPPLPESLVEFLSEPNPAVIATIGPDGRLHTAATWYLWEGGRVLVNMDESRRRLEHMRANPHVSLTVMELANWSSHVSLQGRVVSLEEDPRLRDIDRISTHYTGKPYYLRDHRRYSAWIEVDRWHAWHPENI